jgi:hypothetical protein
MHGKIDQSSVFIFIFKFMIKELKKHRSQLSEHKEQVQFFNLCDSASLVDKSFNLIFAIPNQSYGGTRQDMLRGKKLKAEGRKSGVPDIFVPIQNDSYNGLFIEMKTKYNKTQENQDKWLSDLFNHSFDAVIAYSAIDAFNYVCDYLAKREGISKSTRQNILNLKY